MPEATQLLHIKSVKQITMTSVKNGDDENSTQRRRQVALHWPVSSHTQLVQCCVQFHHNIKKIS